MDHVLPPGGGRPASLCCSLRFCFARPGVSGCIQLALTLCGALTFQRRWSGSPGGGPLKLDHLKSRPSDARNSRASLEELSTRSVSHSSLYRREKSSSTNLLLSLRENDLIHADCSPQGPATGKRQKASITPPTQLCACCQDRCFCLRCCQDVEPLSNFDGWICLSACFVWTPPLSLPARIWLEFTS